MVIFLRFLTMLKRRGGQKYFRNGPLSICMLEGYLVELVGFYPTHARFRFLSFWLTRGAARVGGNLSSSVEKVFYTLFMFNTSVLRVPLRYKGLVLGWFSPVLSFGQRIGALYSFYPKMLNLGIFMAKMSSFGRGTVGRASHVRRKNCVGLVPSTPINSIIGQAMQTGA